MNGACSYRSLSRDTAESSSDDAYSETGSSSNRYLPRSLQKLPVADKVIAGHEYDSLVKSIVNGSELHSLPRDSLYGVCVVLPQVARQLGWHPIYVGKVLKAYMALTAVYLMQFTFVAEVHGLVLKNDSICSEEPEDCRARGYQQSSIFSSQGQGRWYLCYPENDGDSPNSILRKLCALSFTMWLFKDVRQTYEIAHLIWRLPNKAGTWLVIETSEETHVTEGEEGTQQHYATKADVSVEWQIDAMQKEWKIITVIFIILPKLMVFLNLWYYGNVWLLNTSDRAELILNAVALVFVLDLDEAAFAAVMNSETQRNLDNLQSWNPGSSDDTPAEKGMDGMTPWAKLNIICSVFTFPVLLTGTTGAMIWFYDVHCQ